MKKKEKEEKKKKKKKKKKKNLNNRLRKLQFGNVHFYQIDYWLIFAGTSYTFLGPMRTG